MSEIFKKLITEAVTEVAKQISDAVGQTTTPAPPRPRGEPAELIAWRRKLEELESSLKRFPHVMDALGEPATDLEIKRANSALSPFRLPRWLEELYRWHNGCDRSVAAIFGRPFNSISESLVARVDPFDFEFGYVREFVFPFLGVDSSWTMAILDHDGSVADHTLLGWDYEDTPSPAYENAPAWIDNLLQRLESVDENSFADDGKFNYYDPSLADRTDWVPERFEYGGVHPGRWPESYRQRAGISNYIIREAELPAPQERWLDDEDEPIPHAGPWDVYFGAFQTRMKYRTPKPPTQIRLRTAHHDGTSKRTGGARDLNCFLPAGILSDYTLRYGTNLNAVVWFRKDTLDAEIPVIDRVRFPIE